MFGEGRHPHIDRLFETKLAPFLTQSANHFWSSRLWYFKRGLYYQGGMVSSALVCLAPVCILCCCIGVVSCIMQAGCAFCVTVYYAGHLKQHRPY